jgi:hypothetical protein
MLTFRDGSGTGVYAGPCPCGDDKSSCRLPKVGLPAFDLDREISLAEQLVAKADSLPHVIERLACPKGCTEDHEHQRHGFHATVYATLLTSWFRMLGVASHTNDLRYRLSRDRVLNLHSTALRGNCSRARLERIGRDAL